MRTITVPFMPPLTTTQRAQQHLSQAQEQLANYVRHQQHVMPPEVQAAMDLVAGAQRILRSQS